MKRVILPLFCFCLILNVSMIANAQEVPQKVGEGYTSEGVYYEVFITESIENNDISSYSTGIIVTREKRYSGSVIPEATLAWSEEISGETYSGILKLSGYGYTSNETVATYKGMLYKE